MLVPRSTLSSLEYAQLFALIVERGQLTRENFSDNEYTVILEWLNKRIGYLESKKPKHK